MGQVSVACRPTPGPAAPGSAHGPLRHRRTAAAIALAVLASLMASPSHANEPPARPDVVRPDGGAIKDRVLDEVQDRVDEPAEPPRPDVGRPPTPEVGAPSVQRGDEPSGSSGGERTRPTGASGEPHRDASSDTSSIEERVNDRVPDIDGKVRERTESLGAGKIVVCKIVAGTRGDGAGLCRGMARSVLSGATFQLRGADGSVRGSCTTGVDGSCTFIGLPIGSYTVTETAAPAGYVLDVTPRTVTISATDVRPKVFIENEPVVDPSPPGDPTDDPADPADPPDDPADPPDDPDEPDEPDEPSDGPGTIGNDGPPTTTDPDPTVTQPVTDTDPAPGSEVLEEIETLVDEDPPETDEATTDARQPPAQDAAVVDLARTGGQGLALLILLGLLGLVGGGSVLRRQRAQRG